MPLFIVYPVNPKVLEKILDALGEPSDLEVGVSVKDERLKELIKPDEAELFTIQYTCKPKAERVLELYREYYEDYVNLSKGVRAQVSEKLRTISYFKAKWYVDGFLAEFNGFKLKIHSRGNIGKAIEIIQLFKEKTINMEIDLSSRGIQNLKHG